MLRHLGKPIRTVLLWQFAASAAMTLGAGFLAGVHGAISAAAGGAISICACLSAAFVASRGKSRPAGGVLVGALTAEAIKIVLAVLLLWTVLAGYAEARVGILIATFVVTMLIFTMAFFVREHN